MDTTTSLTNTVRKGPVVVWTVTCRKDCKGDYRKVNRTRRDLLSIDLRNAMSWIPKSATAECTENNMTYLMFAQGVELGCNSPPSVMGVEFRSIPEVLSRCTKLKEWKDMLLR